MFKGFRFRLKRIMKVKPIKEMKINGIIIGKIVGFKNAF
jgi:hypothetical protein